ncbi:nicotinate phosphoribosyltransferase [Lysinibacillus fusiformis]|uniref:nicotinate phosphoribosyltransferase n=1 Tax=Lysinibacillus fusiformis TaxID=28031 RepID=UPI000D370DFB|nr:MULTISPECIES: nicotinate phosphoribosyltransferase [Lysinibacillus]MCG7437293.1 nicotinate phosphoribosyltransferase [Lysinibacillus fusiformis]MED4667910.1 nicotinate phosphoribosyltransferase [Lysinibacillus fusiformis]NOG29572.1 nicotinate phosphoribosyltransferase [Lysinibacillus fusiformis]QAS58275.1 nicotinate phosphoribosyltransferase [Lysinibacillus sphaericus]RDV31654.1 nicotinate phosphoribosyltransferase [Lysinibacillus fusiformis]
MEGNDVKYADDSFMLHTDLYQINMVQTYWKDAVHQRKAVFELYFRKLPFGNGYAIFAGLKKVMEFINNFGFSQSDIEYLREEGNYPEEFLHYLQNLKFTGTIRGMREGELVFANEPILRIEAPLAEAQLIETPLLNIVNFQTLIATKASRIKEVTGEDVMMEFGTRRAHEFDAAIWGTRAAYIGGFSATSNVRAGKLFGIPVSGTHAHAMIQTYRDEYTAFKKYAAAHKDCVFLVDTYDTLRSGVPNAIKVAKELGDQINFIGIRLDSGDLAYLSKVARKMLDDAGFKETKIMASNDLDEYTIMHLKSQGAKIDAWGIGTKLITAYDQAALGGVYKLVSIENENGEMVDTIKISANPEKVTTPGRKRVYRIVNNENGHAEGDYIALDEENIQQTERLKMFHPVHTYITKFVTNFTAIELHESIVENGKVVFEEPTIQETQAYAKKNLKLLWCEYKRTMNPEEYPVDLSQACWDHKRAIIHDIKEKISKKMDTR